MRPSHVFICANVYKYAMWCCIVALHCVSVWFWVRNHIEVQPPTARSLDASVQEQTRDMWASLHPFTHAPKPPAISATGMA